MEEFLKELGITNEITSRESDKLVIDIEDSEDYGKIYSRLDKSDLVEYFRENPNNIVCVIGQCDSDIDSILSLTGNNKCFECEDSNVDWVSFPAAVFICLNCGKRHKEFKFKPILKSLSVSEFTQHEIKKMNLGGNARYRTLIDEYKISLKEPNIEYKYNTVISLYYFKLLEIQVNKIENNIGADEEYNKILGERPTYDVGRQRSQGYVINEGNIIKEVEVDNDNNNKYKTNSALGEWLGYF